MNEPEGFLGRWARRKHEASQGAEPERKRDADEAAPESAGTPEASGKAAAAEGDASRPQTIDLSELPSLDSISAGTDVRGFLQPGVPDDLTRAALRRAWSSDPAISEFVGLVENGWDFNNPDSVPGFGRIAAGDAARLLSQAIGALEPDEVRQQDESGSAAAASDAGGVARESETQEAKPADAGVAASPGEPQPSGDPADAESALSSANAAGEPAEEANKRSEDMLQSNINAAAQDGEQPTRPSAPRRGASS